MINDNTNFLKLPLPHPDNLLEDDAPRLRDALTGVDVFAQTTDQRVTGAEQELTRKADASATDTALHALGGRVDQVAAELAGDISQLSGAVKTAHDKGVEGVNAAAEAKTVADAALGAASAAKAVTDTVSSAPAPNAIPRAGADGKLAAGWVGNGGGMIPAGHIAMLPFRYNQLPAGWYFCNGTRYNTTTTAVGAALKALPATLKSDWGMGLSGSGTSETINVPNWFYGGRGPVMRAVDGSSRQVGSVEDGAVQNITGSVDIECRSIYNTSGSIFLSGKNMNITGSAAAYDTPSKVNIDVSRQVATASETRMLNRGMTPAIFLGV